MRTKHLLISIILSLVSVQAFALVPIKHWQTSQGGQVYFVASPGLPMVDIRLVFDAGSARDGKHHGIASLTASLLETGAGQWDVDQIAQQFDAVGAKYGHATNRDTSWVGLRSLTQADLLAQSVDTFQAIISRPQFAQAEFQRIKEQKLIGLKQQQEKPGFIAKKTFYQSIYSEHPYAHLVAGDAESLRQIQLSDIKQFYQQFYVTKNGVLAIVGDLTQQQAWQIAETLFKQLKPGENAEELPQVNLPKKSKTEHIDFPSTQTHILAGMPVLSRKDPDYFPLYVGNHILGGSGLVSLLFNEIRGKRGLAYSAYSYFSPLEEAGPFTMGLQTQNKQSNIAVEVMQKTLADFILQGPTEEQLIAAQKNLTGGFVLRFDNNRKLLNYIAMLAFYQLPLDYLDTFSGKVANVTAEQVKSAFQRRVKTNLLQIISVGGL
ncbi:zinc protease [Bathymodiolus platifrons methanotrophic gill symbiont]|uniref:M16 family metallopeptidase n=1 Tax=Bathymodiolus platifrons methanotrophic gill symbiont TaxID=113268 RepID=UPI001B5AA07B|nr:pitrilysin family protein [Bathymodiolus platifrons methanotrophic gill symbiont]GFO74073.1 zinc protease [Bathymodiolus platifrons methanotrophic gill symbiont]